MKNFSVAYTKVYASIAAELDFAEKHNRYAQKCVHDLAENISFSSESILSSLRFNQHQRDIYLERAAAMLEIVGLFNPEEQSADLGTLNTIRQNMELALKEQNVI